MKAEIALRPPVRRVISWRSILRPVRSMMYRIDARSPVQYNLVKRNVWMEMSLGKQNSKKFYVLKCCETILAVFFTKFWYLFLGNHMETWYYYLDIMCYMIIDFLLEWIAINFFHNYFRCFFNKTYHNSELINRRWLVVPQNNKNAKEKLPVFFSSSITARSMLSRSWTRALEMENISTLKKLESASKTKMRCVLMAYWTKMVVNPCDIT